MRDFGAPFASGISSRLGKKEIPGPLLAVRIGISFLSGRPIRLVSYVISQYYPDESAWWILGASVYAASRFYKRAT